MLALAPAVAAAALALPNPIAAGDWPDPSVAAVPGGGQVAVTTSEGWAPAIRILRSGDGRSWRLAGSVFTERPKWVKRNFWAPEITRVGGRWAVYYSALQRKKGGWYCVGVATSKSLSGPWRDRGRPLRCGRDGSIDGSPFTDAKGRRYLLYKNDGNAFDRPTYIWAQRLARSGTRVVGKPRRLIRNDQRWEGKVVEAPTMVRRGRSYYLFYSGSTCCEQRCSYSVGVARAPTVFGRWRKHRENPILRGGGGWRCAGHTSVARSASGPRVYFHAFRSGALLAGRQLLSAPLHWRGGWPRIGAGRASERVAGAPATAFADSFATLAPDWEWPLERRPSITAAGGLTLRSPGSDVRPDGAVLSRRVEGADYTLTAEVDPTSLTGESAAGVAVYRPNFAGIGVAASRTSVSVWRRTRKGTRRLTTVARPAGQRLSVRAVVRDRRVSFAVSADGSTWVPVGGRREIPLVHSGRPSLVVGDAPGASARFTSARLTLDSR